MSEFVVKGVPTGEVKSFCRLQRAIGATKCDGVDAGGGLSDVTVGFPDEEQFDDRKKRINR
ncbi:hypothetical protein [uncultured Sphingomonas sp.]|uniref:hypothetical protein n=1 Tax=uncultured Sphingomonas sp. TaxID=158754 RepID=UPI0035CB4BB0